MTWSKNAPLAFIPFVMFAFVFGIAYVGISSISTSSSNSSNVSVAPLVANPSTSCTTHFNYDNPNPISVLVIKSGTTGQICVSYSNGFNNTISLPSYITIYGACSSCDFNNATSSFQVSTTPDSVMFPQSANSETVSYTIKVPTNVTSGIYGVFLLQFCSLFPMVVVPNNASSVQLSVSEFSSWYPHTGSCPAQVLGAQLLGVSGFNVVTLT